MDHFSLIFQKFSNYLLGKDIRQSNLKFHARIDARVDVIPTIKITLSLQIFLEFSKTFADDSISTYFPMFTVKNWNHFIRIPLYIITLNYLAKRTLLKTLSGWLLAYIWIVWIKLSIKRNLMELEISIPTMNNHSVSIRRRKKYQFKSLPGYKKFPWSLWVLSEEKKNKL